MLLFLVLPLFILVYLAQPAPVVIRPKVVFRPPTPSPSPTLTPIAIGKNLPPPTISARQVFIIDRASKLVIFQKSATEKIYPASTTKMMTALVALDAFKLDQSLTVSQSFVQGQNLNFTPNEIFTTEQLLYALLVYSANDAAEVLAQNYPGGRAEFITAMNTKAADLHLSQTHFLNPTGLDEEGHFSSAVDLVRLADKALENPEFAKIVSVEASVITSAKSQPRVITNINQLLGKVPGVKGVKSGLTDKAGQSLVTFVDRDHHSILLAVLGSQDRFADTSRLIEWLYANFDWVAPGSLDLQR